jgi:cytochrome c-type biogenesis protein CcmH
MTLFWSIGAALAAVVLILIARPLLKGRADKHVSRRDANISIYRDQLRELDADLAAGTLAQADYERVRRELEARLLEDAVAAPASAPARSNRALAAALALAIPALALGV